MPRTPSITSCLIWYWAWSTNHEAARNVIVPIPLTFTPLKSKYSPQLSGFDGLWYPCSRVETRPNPSDFSGRKNPQYAFLRKGRKAVCPMSHICGMKKNPIVDGVAVAAFGRNYRPFLAQVVPPFTTRFSGGDTWRCK